MIAALARARDAGVEVTLLPAGRMRWQSARPIEPDLLAELRARREDIRCALAAAHQAPAWPEHLLADTAEVTLPGEVDTIERDFSL